MNSTNSIIKTIIGCFFFCAGLTFIVITIKSFSTMINEIAMSKSNSGNVTTSLYDEDEIEWTISSDIVIMEILNSDTKINIYIDDYLLPTDVRETIAQRKINYIDVLLGTTNPNYKITENSEYLKTYETNQDGVITSIKYLKKS